jgi:hypothetical protein
VDDRKEKLIEQYDTVGHFDGRTLLLRHADALRFIDDCERAGLVILGMDFFDIQPRAIIPLVVRPGSSGPGVRRQEVRQVLARRRGEGHSSAARDPDGRNARRRVCRVQSSVDRRHRFGPRAHPAWCSHSG